MGEQERPDNSSRITSRDVVGDIISDRDKEIQELIYELERNPDVKYLNNRSYTNSRGEKVKFGKIRRKKGK